MLEASVLDFPMHTLSMEYLAINTSHGKNITDTHVRNQASHTTYLPPKRTNMAANNW